ncbi:hypothetical protein HPB49_023858 [Dermacentor silvarum]|uniref:Uncharacterized protein n=1 Tax=Dermacentor silvarum TaxID=543639 RepID=A0ACB8CC62_DERSI|nr:hypothetical protein HPB49_023858 [Dermacentor silvarum]
MRRWRRRRHNKKLRRRIAKLERDIDAHSATLERQQWGQICNSLNGQMGCKKTWHLLRHLIDPGSSKLAVRKQFERIMHQYPGTDEELLEELANQCNTSLQNQKSSSANATTVQLPQYTGIPNQELDADISEAEVGTALIIADYNKVDYKYLAN